MKRRTLLIIMIILIQFLLSGCEVNEVFNFNDFEVETYSPGLHQTGVAEDAVVEVTFNNEADDKLVEQHFTLTGPAGKIEGEFTWLSQHTFQFRPRYDLEMTKRYVIEIPRDARDSEGKKLKTLFISDFYVGDPTAEFSIASTNPVHSAGGNIYNPDLPPLGTGPLKQIQIIFSNDFDKIKTEAAFSISPNIPGHFEETTDPRELLYVLTSEPDYGKQYKVTVASTAEDTDGNTLGTDHKIIFIYGNDTDPPTVEIGTDPVNDPAIPTAYWPPPNAVTEIKHTLKNIYIVFSEEMEKASCEQAFSIDPIVNGNLKWFNNSNNIMLFELEENLKQEQLYTITVNTNAKDSHGLKLKSQYNILLTTTNPESKHITIGKVLGSGDDTFDEATELLFNGEDGGPHSKAWPHRPIFQSYTVNTIKVVKCYFRIQFLQNSTPIEMDKTSIYSNYFIEPVGIGETPTVTKISWASNSEVDIEISTLEIKSPGEQNLYRFTLYGNESGIKDKNGNIMDGNLIFEFKHKE